MTLLRFSIRDLLWATVVVAMGLGWWLSYRDAETTHSLCRKLEAERNTRDLEIAKLRDEVQRLGRIVLYQGVPPREKISVLTLDGQ